jgi:Zn-dependent M28 family amino/carboxypeptidase
MVQAVTRVDLQTFTSIEIADTFNIICDTQEGDPATVVIMGAHLDSVPEGPGLVDNASGSSTILEVFLQLYRQGLNTKLVNKLRFIWFAAEELGLLGSRHYARVLSQTPADFEKVVIMSNHDMLASPNYVPFVRFLFPPTPIIIGSSWRVGAGTASSRFDKVAIALRRLL